MTNTIEAVIDEKGAVRLLESYPVTEPRRALVTILEEPPLIVSETTLLSEASLAEDWNRPEEDEAWLFLQSAQS